MGRCLSKKKKKKKKISVLSKKQTIPLFWLKVKFI